MPPLHICKAGKTTGEKRESVTNCRTIRYEKNRNITDNANFMAGGTPDGELADEHDDLGGRRRCPTIALQAAEKPVRENFISKAIPLHIAGVWLFNHNIFIGKGKGNTMPSETVIVALLSFGGTFIGALMGIIASSRLTTHRLGQLEKVVEKHNDVLKRTFILEEKMKAASHRINDLEELQKTN